MGESAAVVGIVIGGVGRKDAIAKGASVGCGLRVLFVG